MEHPTLVLLTGVTGHSGRFFIERLSENRDAVSGMRFRAVVRETSDVSQLLASGLPIELVRGDLTDEAFLETACAGVDTVLHIAGIHWSREVSSAAAKCGVRRWIFVHTTGIYSKFKAAVGDYKNIDAFCEERANASGALLTILRPTMIYGGLDDGNVAKFIAMVAKLPVMPVVSGARYALQPVHRRDLGRAYYDVLTNPAATDGKRYVLSGKEPIDLCDMLKVIGTYLGKPRVRFLSVPYWFAYAGATVLYGVTLGKIDYREKVQRLVEPRAYPHDDAARDFGFAPVGFSEGVRDEVAAYAAAHAAK